MGFRFRKRIKLVPGLWINLSTGGPGGKGLTANIDKRGIRTTVSVPGSGFSYTTKTVKWGEGNSPTHVPHPLPPPLPSQGSPPTVLQDDSNSESRKKVWIGVFVILCAAVVFWWNVCAENQRSESDRGALESLSTSELSESPAPTAKTTLSPVPEITHEVRRAELVATPIEVRRAELVVPPHADKRTYHRENH
jgi:hypothetical protein